MTNFSCLSAVYELIIFEHNFLEVYCYNLLKKTGIDCFIVLVFCFIQCFVFVCSSLHCLYVFCVMSRFQGSSWTCSSTTGVLVKKVAIRMVCFLPVQFPVWSLIDKSIINVSFLALVYAAWFVEVFWLFVFLKSAIQ